MDTVLIVVTVMSLAMAIAMAIVVVKLLRDERERSDARVAALSSMATRPVPRREETPLARAPRGNTLSRPSPGAAAVPVEPLRDLELHPGLTGARVTGDLFADRREPSPWGRRLAVIGTLTAVLAAALFMAAPGRGHSDAAPAGAAVAATAANVPLELVALRHTRDAQGLTISGLVENPKTGAPQSRLVATAFVFGPDGTFLTSSRAPIDIRTLAPGDESPFVVTVPVNGEVSRYRIGFRTEDGRVVSHVDKRTPDTLASKQEP
jgi:hypothetical protein